MKIKKIILIIIAILYISTFLGCTKTEENTLEVPHYIKKEPVYITQVVEKRMINEVKMVYAKVLPIQEEVYNFNTYGYIQEVFVENGQQVKIGDPLIKLEAEELINKIRDMRISYEIEKLKIEKLKDIYKSAGNGKYELDIALLNFKIIQYEYDKLLEAEKDLYIYSTIDGIVDSVKVRVNQYIDGKTPIIKIIDNRSTILSFANPNIGSLIVGTEVELFVEAKQAVKATVIEDDKKNGTIIIKPNIKDERFNTIGRLYKVEMVIDQVNDTIAVKQSWIHDIANRKFVYVLNDGVMTEREISMGKVLGEWVEVLLGIEEGEEIIIN